MACVVLKPGHHRTVEELAAIAQRELGDYKAPKVIKLVEQLPKNPSGKVQRLKRYWRSERTPCGTVARFSGQLKIMDFWCDPRE
jgi:acyl-CoA synthetase (AMP-forming)/AMP-acid ligase II